MNDHELDQLLRATSAPLDAPAGFQREVWSRIEAEETSGLRDGLRQLLERTLAFFAQPKIAVATCAAMVVIGTWLGMQSPQAQATGELAYVQAVSPFAHTHR